MSDTPDHLVPGVLHCARCKLQLVRTNLYMQSGTTGPGNSDSEPCPNGCGPLWPVTWKDWATEGHEMAEKYFLEARDLRVEFQAAQAELAEARNKILHEAWLECKIIESRYEAQNDPYDDHLSQVATECADAIQSLSGIASVAVGGK